MTQTVAKRGFFRNAIDAMVAAREKQARRYVANALIMLDDETLKLRGYSRAELQRKGGTGHMF